MPRSEGGRRRILKCPVHRSLRGKYYVDKKTKIECMSGGIVFGLLGVIPAVLFAARHNYAAALVMGVTGCIMSLVFLCYPSLVLYRHSMELTDSGVEYSGINFRFFQRKITGSRIPYSDIRQLFVDFYKPLSCRHVDDEYWNKMFGLYIIGKNQKGDICFAFSYQEEAWNILVERCRDTADLIVDAEQYKKYLDIKRKIEKAVSDVNGSDEVIDSYSGYIN